MIKKTRGGVTQFTLEGGEKTRIKKAREVAADFSGEGLPEAETMLNAIDAFLLKVDPPKTETVAPRK